VHVETRDDAIRERTNSPTSPDSTLATPPTSRFLGEIEPVADIGSHPARARTILEHMFVRLEPGRVADNRRMSASGAAVGVA
jgi:hypothetical protein